MPDKPDDIDVIPLKVLPHTPEIKAFILQPETAEGEDIPADNVLIHAIGLLNRTVLTGRTIDGHPFFASSTDDYDVILSDLARFTKFIEHAKWIQEHGGDY